MGFRSKPAIPGILIALVATALLAIVSFNTPLLKSQYFLQANYSTGEYAGTLKLGTLGYCLNSGSGNETCVGPRIGYNFSPNDLLGVTSFNIPEVITKYLTYVLFLHVIALIAIVISILFALLSLCSISVLCFPVLFASLGSTFSLISLAFDLAMFYIAKARIDAVSGASATIGTSVWLTLAAWILCGLAACCYGVGSCCCGSGARSRQQSGDPKNGSYGDYSRANSGGPDRMRLDALRDEELRKKEQGLPTFQTLETTPLTARGEEDKYLDDGHQQMPGGLRRDGSVVNGVGMGYGRRNPDTVAYNVGYAGGSPWDPSGGMGSGSGTGYAGNGGLMPPQPARRLSGSDMLSNAGQAGLGAGGGGVENPNNGYGYYQQHQQQGGYDDGGCAGAYGDPSGQQNHDQGYYNDPYAQQTQTQQHQYPPSATPYDPYASSHMPDPYGQGQGSSRTPDPYATSHTPDPYAHMNQNQNQNQDYAPHQRISTADPYGGYEDGLGAIGMAATTHSAVPVAQQGYNDSQLYGGRGTSPAAGGGTIYTPQPQHLVGPDTTHLLRSPASVHSDANGQRGDIVGQNPINTNGYDQNQNQYQYDNHGQGQPQYQQTGDAGYTPSHAVSEPPSYGVAMGGGSGEGYQCPPEKASYR